MFSVCAGLKTAARRHLWLAGLGVATACASGFISPADARFSTDAGAACIATMPAIMHAVVRVESSYNRYAIGVVGGRLVRQPRSQEEATATAYALEAQGRNFSLGLAQINRFNLARLGLSYESVFDPCLNINAGARILSDCLALSHGDLPPALGCYYSGKTTRGQDYARRVLGVSHNPTVSAVSGSVMVEDQAGAVDTAIVF